MEGRLRELNQKHALQNDLRRSLWQDNVNNFNIVLQKLQSIRDFNINEVLEDGGFASLHIASKCGNPAFVETLVGVKSLDVNAATLDGSTALHIAASEGFDDVIEMLLTHQDVEIDKIDNRGKRTALIAACEKGNVEAARVLVEGGANLEIADDKGNRPLHHAVIKCNYDIAKLLLQNGANSKASNGEKRTPMQIATKVKVDKKIVDLLIINRGGGNQESRLVVPRRPPPSRHAQMSQPRFQPLGPKAPTIFQRPRPKQNIQGRMSTRRDPLPEPPPEPQKHKQTPRDDDEGQYGIQPDSRGKCVIFNLEPTRRKGCTVDESRLERAFQSLGYTVQIHRNISVEEIMLLVHNLAYKTDHKQFDSFVCCILAHGSLGKIYADDDVIKLSEITANFKSSRSKTLCGKPKLFFIQACRGEFNARATRPGPGGVASQLEEDADRGADEQGVIDAVVGDEADFLLSHATVPGCQAVRHPERGSVYVQTLCDVLERVPEGGKDIFRILTEVNRRMSHAPFKDEWGHECVQTSTFTTSLTKTFVFRPTTIKR